MSPEISEYINSIDKEWQRTVLKRLRKLIHEVDPQIEEKIKWGSPTYYHSGPVIWMFCARDWVHVSFPHGALLDSSHGLFEPTENKAQRTIKIRESDKFPEKILVELVAQAVSNNIEGKKISFNIPKPGSREFDLPRQYEKLLSEKNLLSEFKNRPYYQQSGWIRWIETAKQPGTKERRIKQMLDELEAGNLYMKMPW